MPYSPRRGKDIQEPVKDPGVAYFLDRYQIIAVDDLCDVFQLPIVPASVREDTYIPTCKSKLISRK